MENEKILFEIDLHGVIADLYSYIEEQIINEGYKDFSFQNVKNYEVMNSGIGCPKVIIDKYINSVDSFLNCKPYEGALEFIDWVKSKPDVDVVIHSFAVNTFIGDAITEWCKQYIPDCELILDIGIAKKMLSSDVCIEDSLENLSRSVAAIKYIRRQHHNREEYNHKWARVFDESLVVETFEDIKKDLESILPETFN